MIDCLPPELVSAILQHLNIYDYYKLLLVSRSIGEITKLHGRWLTVDTISLLDESYLTHTLDDNNNDDGIMDTSRQTNYKYKNKFTDIISPFDLYTKLFTYYNTKKLFIEYFTDEAHKEIPLLRLCQLDEKVKSNEDLTLYVRTDVNSIWTLLKDETAGDIIDTLGGTLLLISNTLPTDSYVKKSKNMYKIQMAWGSSHTHAYTIIYEQFETGVIKHGWHGQKYSWYNNGTKNDFKPQ